MYFQRNGCNGDYTANECSLLGFNKANLLCSSCEQLSKFQLGSLRYNYINNIGIFSVINNDIILYTFNFIVFTSYAIYYQKNN